jgi:hypothetical protein
MLVLVQEHIGLVKQDYLYFVVLLCLTHELIAKVPLKDLIQSRFD